MLDVALLGTVGMMPLPNRGLAACVIRQDGRLLLIDCGEGTQVSERILGWGFRDIDVICITHFHADHVSGLPGLLLSIGHSGREEPVSLVGPVGLCDIVESLLVIAKELPFGLRFIEVDMTKEQTINESVFTIGICPAKHRGACLSYSITLNRQGKFDPIRAKLLPIPINMWSRLQSGESLVHEGCLYTPDMVLGPPREGLKVTYITDTRPTQALTEFARNSNLLVCEGVYGEDTLKHKAAHRGHMIFSEAAALAAEARVRELWLTHFSPSLANPKMFLCNARNIFSNTHAGYDRKRKTIAFDDGTLDFTELNPGYGANDE